MHSSAVRHINSRPYTGAGTAHTRHRHRLQQRRNRILRLHIPERPPAEPQPPPIQHSTEDELYSTRLCPSRLAAQPFFLFGEHPHSAQRGASQASEGARDSVTSHLAVDLDEALHEDGLDLLVGERVLQAVAKDEDKGKALAELVGARRGAGGLQVQEVRREGSRHAGINAPRCRPSCQASSAWAH